MWFNRTLFAAVGLTATLSMQLALAQPSGVECIAPSDPGGGWDFTCRSVGRLLEEQDRVDGSVKVTNMSGGDGGVGMSYVVSKRNEDPNLLVAASTATISNLAQDRYTGLDHEAVRWVASLGADFGAIVVREDSPYENLNQLLDDVMEDPSQVSFGGGSVAGTWDDLKVRLLAKAAGMEDIADINYVAFNSGGPAQTQLLGGHIDAYTGDFSEIAGQLEAGNVRVLAILAPERLAAAPDVPTAIEQGYDVIGANWRGFYAPGNISDEEYQEWVSILGELYQSEGWQEAMEANGLGPFWQGGEEFGEFVDQNIEQLVETSREVGVLE
ncbi:tripartite tricarboxylate transporter substrate binding protein [Silicimonas algicola]|uniref:Putative tricarboxylic transport membrane protein n=2 Tax=Silicimonas algicola TaxID=1826607 RepID=A0A316G0W3_9RHOB|nr:tripartite tricarboxylate transporter substrate-binding protein [Silicimonas algicola]AZQ68324.1 tripartite tricarboxylate transporter substrate binding protein [Silicimonas algicola]PWK53606.1 putative tricarboxylic transport membrane protein [Silicimonas algicola]